jgi:uncharacterized spore protein YtfJ
MLHLDESTHLYEKILELAPQAVDKIQQMFAKKDEAKQQSSPQYQNNQAKHDFDI